MPGSRLTKCSAIGATVPVSANSLLAVHCPAQSQRRCSLVCRGGAPCGGPLSVSFKSRCNQIRHPFLVPAACPPWPSTVGFLQWLRAQACGSRRRPGHAPWPCQRDARAAASCNLPLSAICVTVFLQLSDRSEFTGTFNSKGTGDSSSTMSLGRE